MERGKLVWRFRDQVSTVVKYNNKVNTPSRAFSTMAILVAQALAAHHDLISVGMQIVFSCQQGACLICFSSTVTIPLVAYLWEPLFGCDGIA